MNFQERRDSASVPVHLGSYTATEAARLLRTPRRNIIRWLAGYSYKREGRSHYVPPLWASQLNMVDDHLEIGFRDLIELRFVKAFTDAGVGLLAIRNCLAYARECVDDYHPFSTQKFQTDGRQIFLESVTDEDTRVLNLRRRQFEFKQIIERTFKDLDLEDGAVARWRPFKGKKSIVLDPLRAFGQPIAAEYGVPTITLVEAAEAEGSANAAARAFEIPLQVVRDAVQYEQSLMAA